MNRPIHFEIHASDPEAAMKMYSEVFGWRFQHWGEEPYWMVETGPQSEPGINGGIMLSRDGNPRTVNTIEVASVDESAQKVQEHGGQVVVQKMPIPGYGWLVYCTDPCGNLFGIMEPDSEAK